VEWWLLRDDHRAALFCGVWVEARVLLRNYEYGRAMGDRCPQIRGIPLFSFFLLGVLSMGTSSSSSLGFAKSKNGQIEYASTFLEAKPVQARFTLLYQPH